MKKEGEKTRIKREFKSLFKSMDFVCDNYLNKKGAIDKELEAFANIYQQLGLACGFLGLQCRHWDGYRKTRDKEKEARILNDSIDFHGVRLNVDVHNSYKAKLLGGKHDIKIAAERTVKLKESGIECSISQYRIDIRMSTVKKRGEGRIMPISLLN